MKKSFIDDDILPAVRPVVWNIVLLLLDLTLLTYLLNTGKELDGDLTLLAYLLNTGKELDGDLTLLAYLLNTGKELDGD